MGNRLQRRRGLRVGLLAMALLTLVFLGLSFLAVSNAADDSIGASGSGDAIVVLGAAQYNGSPSPVLQARLDTAYALWESGAAPLIVTTGANQPGDAFTEGFAGFRYLRNLGVDEEDIVVITDGGDTYESLLATALQLEGTQGNVVLVTDAYHAERSAKIAGEVGLEAVVVAAGEDTRLGRRLRESIAVTAGRVISYRRLSRLT